MRIQRPPLTRAKGRVVGLVAGMLAASFLVFGAVLGAASVHEYRRDLAHSLERTALAFRTARARAFEQQSQVAELLATDSRFDQYREGLALARPGSAEHEDLREAVRRHLEVEFGTTGGDLLVLVGHDGRIDVVVRRTPPPAAVGTPEPPPSSAEAGAGGAGDLPESLDEGRELSVPLVEKVFEDASPRVGYIHLRPGDPVYAAAAVPLKRGETVEGVLVLAERVGEDMLAQASQGMNQGLIVVEAEGEIVAAHDCRSGKGPSPAIQAALEQSVTRWAPPEVEDQFTAAVEGEAAPIGDLQVAGLHWLNLPVALEGARDQRPVAWALFLADTSVLEERVTREAWMLGKVGLGVVALGMLMAWVLSGWVLAPLAHSSDPGPL